ncbi:hypothetical protein NJR55_12370 [Idiomarina sp. M1R2S28]|uniref:Uncharacterized protein n=1 Tax=Idiomarina rhizosphaerae TaxID=2961572 RepID=A0A9X2FYL7_9GAMM|nr:hypothetical protein [Idiomarina rhizosphaerae]MCP1340385.1 hypothetical protein [Idiomarina rhizosphaerae]
MNNLKIMMGNEVIELESSSIPRVESSATCACRDCTIQEPPKEEEEKVE